MFSAIISAVLGTTFPNYSTFLFTVCVIWLETCVPFSFDVQLYNYWGFCDAVVVANFICLNIQIIYNEKGNLLLDGYWKLLPRSTSIVHSTKFLFYNIIGTVTSEWNLAFCCDIMLLIALVQMCSDNPVNQFLQWRLCTLVLLIASWMFWKKKTQRKL